MKSLTIFLILIITAASHVCEAQNSVSAIFESDSEPDSGYVLYAKIPPHYTANTAKADIKKKQIKICLPGGFIMPTITQRDKDFEKKYKVKFSSSTCVDVGEEDYKGYNKVVFKYLDSTFGNSWREEIRRDAFGLE